MPLGRKGYIRAGVMIIVRRRDDGTKRGEWERKGEGIEKVGVPSVLGLCSLLLGSCVCFR